MKVLVATSETQGQQPGDYDWCVDGELVWIGEVCDTDRRDPAGGCGCGRGFAGMASRRATTTAAVRELAWVTRETFHTSLRESLDAQGWLKVYGADRVAKMADRLLALAARLPVGSIVQRRIDVIEVRSLTPS